MKKIAKILTCILILQLVLFGIPVNGSYVYALGRRGRRGAEDIGVRYTMEEIKNTVRQAILASINSALGQLFESLEIGERDLIVIRMSDYEDLKNRIDSFLNDLEGLVEDHLIEALREIDTLEELLDFINGRFEVLDEIIDAAEQRLKELITNVIYGYLLNNRSFLREILYKPNPEESPGVCIEEDNKWFVLGYNLNSPVSPEMIDITAGFDRDGNGEYDNSLIESINRMDNSVPLHNPEKIFTIDLRRLPDRIERFLSTIIDGFDPVIELNIGLDNVCFGVVNFGIGKNDLPNIDLEEKAEWPYPYEPLNAKAFVIMTGGVGDAIREELSLRVDKDIVAIGDEDGVIDLEKATAAMALTTKDYDIEKYCDGFPLTASLVWARPYDGSEEDLDLFRMFIDFVMEVIRAREENRAVIIDQEVLARLIERYAISDAELKVSVKNRIVEDIAGRILQILEGIEDDPYGIKDILINVINKMLEALSGIDRREEFLREGFYFGVLPYTSEGEGDIEKLEAVEEVLSTIQKLIINPDINVEDMLVEYIREKIADLVFKEIINSRQYRVVSTVLRVIAKLAYLTDYDLSPLSPYKILYYCINNISHMPDEEFIRALWDYICELCGIDVDEIIEDLSEIIVGSIEDWCEEKGIDIEDLRPMVIRFIEEKTGKTAEEISAIIQGMIDSCDDLEEFISGLSVDYEMGKPMDGKLKKDKGPFTIGMVNITTTEECREFCGDFLGFIAAYLEDKYRHSDNTPFVDALIEFLCQQAGADPEYGLLEPKNLIKLAKLFAQMQPSFLVKTVRTKERSRLVISGGDGERGTFKVGERASVTLHTGSNRRRKYIFMSADRDGDGEISISDTIGISRLNEGEVYYSGHIDFVDKREDIIESILPVEDGDEVNIVYVGIEPDLGLIPDIPDGGFKDWSEVAEFINALVRNVLNLLQDLQEGNLNLLDVLKLQYATAAVRIEGVVEDEAKPETVAGKGNKGKPTPGLGSSKAMKKAKVGRGVSAGKRK